MWVQPFAGDKWSHDVCRPFPDPIHLSVAYQLLDAERRFTTDPLGIRRFIPHPSENNLCIFQKLDRVFRTEHLRDGCLNPDVVTMLVGHPPYGVRERFHRKEIRRHATQPHTLGLSLPKGFLKRHSLVRTVECRLPGLLGHSQTNGRDTDRPSYIEDTERVLETPTNFTDDVRDGHADISERHIGILNAPAALELTPLSNLNPRSFHIEDKGGVYLLVRTLAFPYRNPRDLPVLPDLLRRHRAD